MLIILMTILTTSAARTMHSYANFENNSRHRTFLPVLDISFTYKNDNKDQSISTYSYPTEHDLKSGDVVFPGLNTRRRADSEDTYQYPGQWNGPVTVATQLSDRFENHAKEENAFDYLKETTQKPREVVEIKNGHYYTPQNNSKKMSAQLENLNNNQQNNANNYAKTDITTTKPNCTNLNSPRKLNLYPTIIYQTNSNIDQSSINSYQNTVKNIKNKNTYNTSETNMFTTESSNRTLGPNSNLDKGAAYGVKTTLDNEVKETDDSDRWIWSNSETTTLVPLDDRAAFTGNNCPTGTVRIRDTCVAQD